METKCTVCNQGGGHVVCDGCGKAVCFNCFYFVNSRRLCTTCVKEWETKRRWQTYAEQYSKMTADERAGLWATLSPEERSMLEGELAGSGGMQINRGTVRKYAWLAFPILGCLIIIFLLSDDQLLKQASVASKKLGSQVGTLAGSVRRQVVDLTSSSPPQATAVQPPLQTTPIQLVGRNLKKNGLPITAGNLLMKSNPAGEGTIVYSPHYFGPNRRLAWIVIGGQAYSLTEASQEVTPTLRTSRAIPAPVWKKTGLSRQEALSQLQSSLWE